MFSNGAKLLPVLVFAGATQVAAQEPLSAIDWLSDSIATPREVMISPQSTITDNALPETIDVSPLDAPLPDAVGLLPASATGLPADLWRSSSSADIARRLEADRVEFLPALQDLLYTIIMAELEPPSDAGPQSTLFLARIDTLLAYGALEQADALLKRSGIGNSEIFRRAFDISLLLHTEDSTCSSLRSNPDLSPTFPARIFCLARGGDWDAAALTLETGRALGFISDADDELLARFLEPDLADGQPPLAAPKRPSPLTFRMLEAIGEPLPTTILPRAFAQSDLHTNAGWKAQIEAAERLLQTAALDPNQLLGLYTARKPAASGGVWDRVKAVQDFDAALSSGNQDQINETIGAAWAAMASVELEVPFARLFSARLDTVNIAPENADILFEIRMLSDNFESYAKAMDFASLSPDQAFLVKIARGEPGAVPQKDPFARAVRDGFSSVGIPVRLQSLVNQGRMGEAMLRSLELFANGATGDVDELTDALMFFRSVGLDETARRASIELLLLDRLG